MFPLKHITAVPRKILQNSISGRFVSTQVKEILIPFPGGKIAAKCWGNENGKPVLALHGWLDNCGTFDRLIPLLSRDFYFVGFDFIGQGLSSHKPPGMFYEPMDMIIEVKRVVDYLNWSQFTILGHSMGAAIALLYGSIFPDSVQSIISLDTIKPRSYSIDKLCSLTKGTVDRRLALEAKLSDSPVYSYEDAKKRLMEGIVDELTPEAAEIMLIRGTKPCKDKLVFTRDIRLHELFKFRPFCHDEMTGYLSNLSCNLLILFAKQSILRKIKEFDNNDETISSYRRNCKSFTFIEVNGNHFVHLNEPENVSSHINSFLHQYC